MKLIYAGPESSYSQDPTNFLFNCLRNPNCQRKYFVPIRSLDELDFYADLPGKPDLIDVQLVDLCCKQPNNGGGDFDDDFNNDFDNGGDAFINCSSSILFDKYVIAQTPRNLWYGVFSTSMPTPETLNSFFLKFTFTINGQNYVYYTQELEVEKCLPLTCLKGCYPNEPVGSDAWDCNGIYYGFPSGKEDTLGDPTKRYFHKACVRWGGVIDYNAKITLSIFNYSKTYKTKFHKEKMLEFEFVPAFYKDVILGIFIRGNVKINDSDYLLQEEQTWQIMDIDSKLWRLDTLLTEDCLSYFGCAPADCQLPIPICVNNMVRDDFFIDEGSGDFIQLFSGSIGSGSSIDWELYDRQGELITTGNIPAPPWEIDVPGVNPFLNCYTLKWRIKCQFGEPSEWKEEKFGNCIEQTVIAGNFSISSYGNGNFDPGHQHCSAQGTTRFRFRFTAPLPVDLVLQFATIYYADNGTFNYQAFGDSIVPASNPDKAIFSNPLYNNDSNPWEIALPSGTTDVLSNLLLRPDPAFPSVNEGIISYPLCNNVWGGNARHKIYYKVISPANTKVNFGIVYDTPAPFNTVPGGVVVLEEIL